MGSSSRAAQAQLFIRHCRRPQQSPYRHHPRRHASSTPYNPSNFTRPSTASAFSASSPSGSAVASRPSYAHPPAKPTPPPREYRGTRLTPFTWLKSLFGWKPTPSYTPAPFRAHNNPFRARKPWPPNFRNMTAAQQFHFEKTYRRRAALKWARPTWNKSIRILQQTLVVGTLIYFVFICEPAHGEGTPFDGFRVWFFERLGRLGQLPESVRKEAEELRDEAKSKMKKREVVDDMSPKAEGQA